MISETTANVLPQLDLEPIKMKLMHAESGEGWSAMRTAAVEVEYRRFLYLMKAYPDEQVAPSVDVDTFWHYHILDTAKYAVDCEQVFGYFLHHYPYIGLRGEGDEEVHRRSGERMRELYDQTFGTSPGAAQDAAYCAIGAKPAYCAAGAEAAYCAAGAQAAYCAAGAQAAYCAATAKPAYCAVTAKPAYCAATAPAATRTAAATAAYCAATTKAAYCAATAKAAYCAATAKAAYCAVTAKPAYCAVTGAAAAKPAYCAVTGQPRAANLAPALAAA